MKKATLLFWILLFPIFILAASGSSAPFRGDDNSRISKVDALFAEWDNRNSPGCALAVIKDGAIIYKRGYGMADLEHDVPISPNTVFYIGSTSKQFVTTCILLLAEQGKLALDDDIRKFIPEFPEYGKPITIRHLVHHTSGIRDYLTLWELSGRSYLDYMPEQAVLDMICRQKELNFTPGEQHLYSNSCYFLLGVIVKRIFGKTLREFAHENIFEPLGMKNSHFHDDNKHIIKNRAFGYTKMDNGEFGNLTMRFDLVGSGGLYTTVEDLFLWDQNFYNNKLGKSGQKLIETMLTNGRLSNGEEVNYAFALTNGVYRGAKTISHGGALGGYRAQLLRFPEHKFSIVILSNLASFNPAALAYKVADIYLAEHLKPLETSKEENIQATATPVTKSEKLILTNSQLQGFVGDYYSDELEVSCKVSTENGRLFLQIKNNPKMPVEPFDKDAFEAAGSKLFFQRSQSSQITGFTVDAGRVKNLKFTKR
ncbi:beta-lactamase family protein [candidate division KSB1 bacterium]|nr:beta-lactamase family protein [candidate division KSB1 bacterium]